MVGDPFALNSRLIQLWLAAARLSSSLKTVTLLSGSSHHPRGEQGETHTSPTVIACLQGVVRVETTGKPCDVHVDEAVVIAPGTWHRHAPLRQGSASLGQGFMLGHSDIELLVPDQAWWLAIPEYPSRGLIVKACQAGARDRVDLVRASLAGLADESAHAVTPMPTAVQKMWLYMRRERLAPITAADVLHASGLKPTRAHLLFTRYFNETPHRLLNRHRLEYASHLLMSGKAVGEVATLCGFRCRRQFTAAFRQAYSLSPRAWVAQQS